LMRAAREQALTDKQGSSPQVGGPVG